MVDISRGEEVGKIELCNTNRGELSEKKNFNKKSTSIFMTIQNENMKNIDNYIYILQNLNKLRYILVGKHDGPKLEHYHIYAMYSSTTTFNSRDFDYAHIKKISSPKATIKYIKCEDKKHIKKGIQCEVYLEAGEAPQQGVKSVKDLMKLNLNERKELAPSTLLSLIKAEEYIKSQSEVDNWLEVFNIDVEWHFGEPGSGKTYTAKKIGRDYRKIGKSVLIANFDKNGFCHKLGNENDAELIIMNEFRDSCLRFNDFLEILTNEHQFNSKHGGFYCPNVKKIVITTIQSPIDIYNKCSENRNQIYRRLTKIYYHYKIANNYECKEYTIEDLIKNQHNECNNVFHDYHIQSQSIPDDLFQEYKQVQN